MQPTAQTLNQKRDGTVSPTREQPEEQLRVRAQQKEKLRIQLRDIAFNCAFPNEETGEGSAFWPSWESLSWNPLRYPGIILNLVKSLTINPIKYLVEYLPHKWRIYNQIEIDYRGTEDTHRWLEFKKSFWKGVHVFSRAVLSPLKSAKIALVANQQEDLLAKESSLKAAYEKFGLIRVDDKFLDNNFRESYKGNWALVKDSTGKGKALACLSLVASGLAIAGTGKLAVVGLAQHGVTALASAVTGVSVETVATVATATAPAGVTAWHLFRKLCGRIYDSIASCCRGGSDLDRSSSDLSAATIPGVSPAMRTMAKPVQAWVGSASTTSNHRDSSIVGSPSFDQRAEARLAAVRANAAPEEGNIFTRWWYGRKPVPAEAFAKQPSPHSLRDAIQNPSFSPRLGTS